jgi:nucleotide-binding universal stress UspA family protein
MALAIHPPLATVPAFARIVCAVNTSRAAQDAAAQAAQLAGPGTALTFIAVTDARGIGLTAQATLGEAHAAEAVEAARRGASADGVPSRTVVLHAQHVNEAVVDAGRDAELLVVGTHGHSRFAGIVLGSVASRAVHSSPVPVLVARSRPDLRFPGVVLVGIAGAEDRPAVVVAARIAARGGGHVVLGHAGPTDAAVRQALAEQAADVLAITGRAAVVMSVGGSPTDRLPGMATSIGAGLIVLGSHGKRGPMALTSVSERVAHRATCSVLVLRPDTSADR